jgi:hypothetical protein
MTVGFANFFWLKLFRRRLYQDHYESPTEPTLPGEKARMPE